MARKKKISGEIGPPRKKRVDIRGQHGCPECVQVFAFAQSLANHMVTHGYDKPEPVAEPKKGKRKQSKLPMKDRKRVTKNLDHYIDDENVEEKERFDDQYHVQDDIMDDDPYNPSVSDEEDSDESDSDTEAEDLEGGLLSGSDASDEESEKMEDVLDQNLFVTAEELAAAENDEAFLDMYYKPFLCGDLFKRPPLRDYKKTKELAMKSKLDVTDFSDVEMGSLNVKLMRFTEQAGLSGECQNNLHDILLEFLAEEHKEVLLTPLERAKLAGESEQKGLEYTSSNPTDSTMFKGCQIEMGNIMDAALNMLKNPILQKAFVSLLILYNS